MASTNNPGSAAHRFLNPLDDAARRFFADERTDVGAFVQGAADLELLHTRNQSRKEFVVSALLYKDPLHGDAGLPVITVPSGHAAVRGILQICIGADYHAATSAHLQHHSFLPCLLLERPAHGGAAGEA